MPLATGNTYITDTKLYLKPCILFLRFHNDEAKLVMIVITTFD